MRQIYMFRSENKFPTAGKSPNLWDTLGASGEHKQDNQKKSHTQSYEYLIWGQRAPGLEAKYLRVCSNGKCAPFHTKCANTGHCGGSA